jgi:hypothetical protein
MVQYFMPSPVMPSQIGVPFMSVPMPFTSVPASAPMSHWWVSSPIVGYASVPSNLPHAKGCRLPLWRQSGCVRASLPCVPRSTRCCSDIEWSFAGWQRDTAHVCSWPLPRDMAHVCSWPLPHVPSDCLHHILDQRQRAADPDEDRQRPRMRRRRSGSACDVWCLPLA